MMLPAAAAAESYGSHPLSPRQQQVIDVSNRLLLITVACDAADDSENSSSNSSSVDVTSHLHYPLTTPGLAEQRQLLKPLGADSVPNVMTAAESSVSAAAAMSCAAATVRRQHNHTIGLIMLLLVVALWVASGMLIQGIFHDLHFSSPFFLTYFSTSLFSVYLPSHYCWQQLLRCWGTRNSSTRTVMYEQLQTITAAVTATATAVDCNGGNSDAKVFAETAPLSHANHLQQQQRQQQQPAQSVLQQLLPTLRISALLCPLWLSLNYTYNLALSMTSISSATILSSSSSLFVLLFGVCLLHTKVTCSNAIGVCCTVTGAALISYKDDGSADSMHGDLLAAVSALCYALYSIMLKRWIPEDSEQSMLLVFGWIGVINMTVLWPLLFLLDAAGIEPLVMPSLSVLGMLLLNGLFGTVISDMLWAQSVVYTTPLIASLGLSLTIPIAMIVDVMFNQHELTMVYVVGSVLVVSGFVLVVVNQ